MEKLLNNINPLAQHILKKSGITSPTQKQIETLSHFFSKTYSSNSKNPLNEKEMACLLWAAQGKSFDQTADLLNMSIPRIKEYRHSIFTKLGCTNITHAVYTSVCYGYLPLIGTQKHS